MSKIWIGIDNGVTGSIGWVYSDPHLPPGFRSSPVFKTLDYQKKVKNVSRIDTAELFSFLSGIMDGGSQYLVALERPMVNPTRFQATGSALRALEATLITLEELQLPYMYIDSKQWQKAILPDGIKGSAELKKASKDVGTRLFPSLADKFKQDADGILIAEWCKRQNL